MENHTLRSSAHSNDMVTPCNSVSASRWQLKVKAGTSDHNAAEKARKSCNEVGMGGGQFGVILDPNTCGVGGGHEGQVRTRHCCSDITCLHFYLSSTRHKVGGDCDQGGSNPFAKKSRKIAENCENGGKLRKLRKIVNRKSPLDGTNCSEPAEC